MKSLNHSDATSKIRVSILEDDPITRESFAALIERESDMVCLSTHESAEHALQYLPSNLPDVLLADINLPGKSGIACVAEVKDRFPQLQVLMITTYEDTESIYDSLRSGASGYLLKRSSAAELLEAIREVHQGGSPMSMNIARKVVMYFQPKPIQPADSDNMDGLTAREFEILSELAKGLHYKEIASQLHISVSTVRAHLHAVYTKLHVSSRTEAVIRFLQR